MFDELQQKLRDNFARLSDQKVMTEDNVKASLKDIKIALLEADVNFRVVNVFLKKVKERAIGDRILASLDPSQQLVKIVRDQLTALMGKENRGLARGKQGPTLVMMTGLQGSGKTTTAAKLAGWLKREKSKPFMVPADIYRPAAIEQLIDLSEKLEVPFYATAPGQRVDEVVREALKEAENAGATHLIVDTAGRLQIDEAMMDELKSLKSSFDFTEILFVADAMTGQEAVNVARRFNDLLDFTGIVLTKTDGDARGGAALSIRAVTQKPVKFVGTGEKIGDLEPFHPARLASKILGMGDVLTLIEKAERNISADEMEEMNRRLSQNQINLLDFEKQISGLSKMGSFASIMGMIPGLGKLAKNRSQLDDQEKKLAKFKVILSSMTMREKIQPATLNASRKKRISKGSGTSVAEVNQMMKIYGSMKRMLRQLNRMDDPATGRKTMPKNMPRELRDLQIPKEFGNFFG